MRFVTEGPDIPNDLIREWRSGEVLFLAGAGVSAPSKLSLFEGFTPPTSLPFPRAYDRDDLVKWMEEIDRPGGRTN
jgi:hypothetical protein